MRLRKPRSIRHLIAAGALCALAAVPASAQGNGKGKKHGPPPSRNALPATDIGATGASPLAWIDDANLLDSGAMSFAVTMMHWQGSGIGETDAPIVDIAAGLTRRLQLSASIPHVVGSSDPSGAAGGLGTTFLSVKYAAWNDEQLGVKVAVAPTVEILGQAVTESLGPDVNRTQWGLPVSFELDQGAGRLYASGGYFSRGIWFAGVGAGFQATQRVGLSISFSRAWAKPDQAVAAGTARNRNEISSGVSYSLTSKISVFGSVGHTVQTLDDNGAGTTVSGGISFFVPTAVRRQP